MSGSPQLLQDVDAAAAEAAFEAMKKANPGAIVLAPAVAVTKAASAQPAADPTAESHEGLADGWFSEKEVMWPGPSVPRPVGCARFTFRSLCAALLKRKGQKFSLKVDKFLVDTRSDYQVGRQT